MPQPEISTRRITRGLMVVLALGATAALPGSATAARLGFVWGSTVPMRTVGTNVARTKVLYAGMTCRPPLATDFYARARFLALAKPALPISKTGKFSGSMAVQPTLSDPKTPRVRETARMFVSGKFSTKTQRYAGKTVSSSVTFTAEIRGATKVYCAKTTYTVKLRTK
jgi:hypothetical protein